MLVGPWNQNWDANLETYYQCHFFANEKTAEKLAALFFPKHNLGVIFSQTGSATCYFDRDLHNFFKFAAEELSKKGHTPMSFVGREAADSIQRIDTTEIMKALTGEESLEKAALKLLAEVAPPPTEELGTIDRSEAEAPGPRSTSTIVLQAAQHGASMTIAARVNDAIIDSTRKVLGPYGTMLDHPFGRATARALIPVSVIYSTDHLAHYIPKAGYVRKASELAIEAASYEAAKQVIGKMENTFAALAQLAMMAAQGKVPTEDVNVGSRLLEDKEFIEYDGPVETVEEDVLETVYAREPARAE